MTGRALADIVRTATLGSYGVTGFAGGPVSRVLAWLGLGQSGLAIRLDDGIEIELDLTVALGVPVAEVARQVDSAIRYALRRALGREVGAVRIHVAGLASGPFNTPGAGASGAADPDADAPGADSG